MARDIMEQFRAYMRDREASFLLAPVKVTAKKKVPEAKLTTFSVPEMKEGATAEVPRWVAEVLEEEDLVERAEESVEGELYRALQREKLQGATQLSPIRGDFYLKLRRYLMVLRRKGANDQHYQKVLAAATSLMTMRLVKMVTLAGYTSQPEPHELLSPEELTLFRLIKSMISLWRETVTGSE
ncbi:MAG: hypothetical protein QXX17_02500 [Conexivisphaerales archaeon]